MWGYNPTGLNGFRLPWVSERADNSTALEATAPWAGGTICCHHRVYFIQVHLVTATLGVGRKEWSVLVPSLLLTPTDQVTRQREERGPEACMRLAMKHFWESDINNLATSHRQTLLTSLEINNNNNSKDKLKNSAWKRSTQQEITGFSRL